MLSTVRATPSTSIRIPQATHVCDPIATPCPVARDAAGRTADVAPIRLREVASARVKATAIKPYSLNSHDNITHKVGL